MKTASQTFDEQSRERIRQAVIAAEKLTGAEIVPVAASASGRYDRAEDIFGFAMALAWLAAVWLVLSHRGAPGDFGAPPMMTTLPLPLALLILIFAFPLHAAMATWFPILRLPFIRKAEMEEEVARAAAAAFHNLRAHGTRGRVGVLIYVSLYERMVRVIADDAVAAKLPQDAWKEVAALMTDAMAKGAGADGFRSAIAKCGDLLCGPFPRPKDDVDELTNELRLLD
jgi:putative membrane protein